MVKKISTAQKTTMQRNDIEKKQKEIGLNIGRIRTSQKMSQKSLADLCRQHGVNLSQPAISNIEKEGIANIFHIIAIAQSLNVSLSDIISTKEVNIGDLTVDKVDNEQIFVTDSDNQEFESYFGDFMTFFYKTNNSGSQALVTGKLTIKAGVDNRCCELSLCLEHGENYTGNMFISRKTQSVYSLLVNQREGDVCFIIFSHTYKKVSAWFADVLTVSTMTNNKRPTTHRMCITRKSNLTELEMRYIKAHLLQNDHKILLKDNTLKELIQDSELPYFVRESLEAICAQSQYRCYYIPEEMIVGTDLPSIERLEYLSYIRSFSASAKYNKIPRDIDQFINDFVENPSTSLQ